MRNVIVFLHVSLDGFVCGPNGELDWATMDEDIWKDVYELQQTVDTALFGRTTYQNFESYWPSVAANPSSRKSDIAYAHWLEQTPKLVFSNTLEQVKWRQSSVVTASIAQEIAHLKQQPGKKLLLFGGASMASTFINQNLVDEYWLLVNPILLGSGKPLWKDTKGRMKLKLASARAFHSGVVRVHYQIDKA